MNPNIKINHLFISLASMAIVTSSQAIATNVGSYQPRALSAHQTEPVLMAQTKSVFTISYIYISTRTIDVKSGRSGRTFKVEYSSPIGAQVGDTVSIIVNSNDKWLTIINERTGTSSSILSVN